MAAGFPQNEHGFSSMQALPEHELKFVLAPDQITRLLRCDWLRTMTEGKPHQQRLQAVYYDTPEWDLRQRGASLRVRKCGHRHYQCFKTMPADHQRGSTRNEFEVPVPDAALHPELIPDESLSPFGREILERVVPIFHTDIRRTLRTLRMSDRVAFELAVDKGTIAAGENTDAVCEIEVELREGTPEDLFEVGHRIVRSVPARLGVLFKADRGFFLAAPAMAPWVKAESVELDAGQTAEEAFARLFATCLRQVRLNEEFTLQTGDPEAVHQLRVGLRRLRSLLQVYKPYLPGAHYKRYTRELKWITRRSGAVRDWDVFAEERIEPLRHAFPELSSLDVLRDQALGQRNRAQSSLKRALRSTRYNRFLLEVSEWVHARRWREQPVTEESAQLFTPARQFADQRLQELHHKVIAKAKRFPELSDEQRHCLRISAKKARYAAEFFGSLYKRKAVDRHLKRLRGIQNLLGELNDIANIAQMSPAQWRREEAQSTDKEVLEGSYATGILVGWHTSKVEGLLDKARKQCAKLEKTEPFWHHRKRLRTQGLQH